MKSHEIPKKKRRFNYNPYYLQLIIFPTALEFFSQRLSLDGVRSEARGVKKSAKAHKQYLKKSSSNKRRKSKSRLAHLVATAISAEDIPHFTARISKREVVKTEKLWSGKDASIATNPLAPAVKLRFGI